jgi:hypothetical protein
VIKKETLEKMKKRFGPNAVCEKVGAVIMVTLDKPDETELERRREEVKAGGPTDDGCPLCVALAKSKSKNIAAVVYDADATLVFGKDATGPFASGFPRSRAVVA